jgi:hypothetical protein
MADRLVAPPNKEEDEEFLTDVDESLLVLREDEDTPNSLPRREKRRSQDLTGLRRRVS